MSGAEAGLVLGLISSVVSIVDASYEIYKPVKDAEGVSEELRRLSDNLPLLSNTLRQIEQVQRKEVEEQQKTLHAARRQAIEQRSRDIKPTINACERDAKSLQRMLDDLRPTKGSSLRDRTMKAAKSDLPRKKKELEDLSEHMLRNLQLLQTNQVFKAAVEDADLVATIQQMNITNATAQVALPSLSPSSNVPFRRDPNVIARGDALIDIQQRLSVPDGRSLSDGKSQVPRACQQYGAKDGGSEDYDDDDDFEEDVALLQDYSLLGFTSDPQIFQMHRLVQVATKRWLELQDQFLRWRDQFVYNLARACPPNGELESWPTCQMLYPHLQSALDLKPEDNRALRPWITIAKTATRYANSKGDGVRAATIGAMNFVTCVELYGVEHEFTLDAETLLASLYYNMGLYKNAETLQKRNFDVRRRLLGFEHPGTLKTMNILALTLSAQGHFRDAESLQREVLDQRRKVDRLLESASTYSSMASLADTLIRQSRWKDAEELAVPAFEGSKRRLGSADPKTVSCMEEVANIYRNTARLTEAEKLQLEIVDT